MTVDFINEITPVVVNYAKKYGLPASICIAQACLESNFGTSELAKNANNLFGRKYRGYYEEYIKRTLENIPDMSDEEALEQGFEILGDGWFAKPLGFIKYPSIESGVEDYFKNIAERDIYKGVRSALPDIKLYLELLGKKYASDGRYAKKVQDIIDRNALYLLDQ